MIKYAKTFFENKVNICQELYIESPMVLPAFWLVFSVLLTSQKTEKSAFVVNIAHTALHHTSAFIYPSCNNFRTNSRILLKDGSVLKDDTENRSNEGIASDNFNYTGQTNYFLDISK